MRKGAHTRHPRENPASGAQRRSRFLRRIGWILVVCGAAAVAVVAWVCVPHGNDVPASPLRTGEAASSVQVPPEIAGRLQTACASIAAGRSDEAVPMLRELLDMLPPADAPRAAVRARIQFSLCVALLKGGKLDAALDVALEALASSPDDAPLNVIAGTLCYEKGRHKEAIERFTRGLAKGVTAGIADDPLNIRCQLAECYRALGRNEDARATIDGVLAENSRHRAALKARAALSYARRDFAEALAVLEGLQKGDAKDADVVAQLMRSALEAGGAGRAVDAMHAFLAAGGRKDDALQVLYAKALAAAGQAKEAVGAAGSLLVVNPEHDEAYFVLANALARAGKSALSAPFRELYNRGTALRSELERARSALSFGDPASAAYYRGRAFARAGRFGAALKDLNEARRRAPANSQIVAALAMLMVNADRVRDAKDDLDAFAREAERAGVPLAAEFLLAQAEVAWLLGDLHGATDALARACKDGRCRRESADLAAGIALLERVPDILGAALAPFAAEAGLDPELQAWRALATYLGGKAADAADALQSAVKALPDASAAAWLGLGMACRDAGRRPQAAEAFRKVIAKEQFLRQAWEGLKLVTDQAEETARADKWLAAAGETEGRLRGEWDQIRGVADSRLAAQALLRAARLRHALGHVERARSVVLLARDLDPLNPEAHRLTVMICTRPEEAFVRLHALEALRRIAPTDTTAEALRQKEYAQLEFAAPEGN